MNPTHPAAEDPLAALQEEIRRAGRDVEVTVFPWWFTAGTMFVASVFLVLRATLGAWSFWVLFAAAPAAIVWLCGCVIVLVARQFKLRALRATVLALDGCARHAVVIPLLTESGEAGRLARRIFRDLGLPTELTPAGRPGGSGAEVSGADGVMRR